MEINSNGCFQVLKNGRFWGYNPLILTIDPNFQRDIQAFPVGQTSVLGGGWFSSEKSEGRQNGGAPIFEDTLKLNEKKDDFLHMFQLLKVGMVSMNHVDLS